MLTLSKIETLYAEDTGKPAWQSAPVIPALGRQRKEDQFKAILGYIASSRSAWAT